MRKLLALLLCLFLPISAFGEPERLFDNTGQMSEEECNAINTAITNFRQSTKTDLAILITDDYLGPGNPANVAKYFYEIMGFGIGPNKDGAIIYLDVNTKTGGNGCVAGYGFWEPLLSEEKQIRIFDSIVKNDSVPENLTRSSAFVVFIDEMLEIYNEYWGYWIEAE